MTPPIRKKKASPLTTANSRISGKRNATIQKAMAMARHVQAARAGLLAIRVISMDGVRVGCWVVPVPDWLSLPVGASTRCQW